MDFHSNQKLYNKHDEKRDVLLWFCSKSADISTLKKHFFLSMLKTVVMLNIFWETDTYFALFIDE